MTPLERLREAAAVPADDVTVSRTDLVSLLETLNGLEIAVSGMPDPDDGFVIEGLERNYRDALLVLRKASGMPLTEKESVMARVLYTHGAMYGAKSGAYALYLHQSRCAVSSTRGGDHA